MSASTAMADPRRWKALILLSAAQFMVILDVSIVTVALPAMARSLGFSEQSLQWVLNAYLLVFGSVLLLGGRAADIFGRRRMFSAGLAIFGLASLVGGFAPSAGVLIAARAVQGLGAAIIAPVALSIIQTLFAHDPKEYTKAMGIWGSSAPVGGAAGVLLGGVLTQTLGWGWVLFVNVPVAALALALTPLLLHHGRPAGARPHLDLAGALSVTGALVLLVDAIVEANGAGWTAPRTLGLVAAAVVLLVAFIAIETRVSQPLVPLGVFRAPNFAGGALLTALLGAAWIPTWYVISLYAQQVLGFSALQAGLAYLPMTLLLIVIMLGAISTLIGRVGIKPLALGGLALLALGALLFARAPVGGTYAADILPASLVAALGMALAFVPITIAGLSGVGPQQAGLASGVLNTAYQIGSALGLAIAVAVATARTTGLRAGGTGHLAALTGGFAGAFVVAAALAALGVAFGLVAIRTPRAATTTPETAGAAGAAGERRPVGRAAS